MNSGSMRKQELV